MPLHLRPFALAALCLPTTALLPLQLQAQEAGDTVPAWSGEAEAGVSLFFGNTQQKIANTRASATRTGAVTELTADFSFSYGDAEGPDGDPFVTKRSWLVKGTGEYRPSNRVSPFGLASVESSFEKRIDARYHLGAGARVNAVSTPRTTVEGSLALLGERTRFDETAAAGIDEELIRWSTGLRVRRASADENLVFLSDTSYRPEFGDLGSFTLSTTNSVSYALSGSLSMKLSFIDGYDSEAEARGAESNNDGQLVFGLLSSF